MLMQFVIHGGDPNTAKQDPAIDWPQYNESGSFVLQMCDNPSLINVSAINHVSSYCPSWYEAYDSYAAHANDTRIGTTTVPTAKRQTPKAVEGTIVRLGFKEELTRFSDDIEDALSAACTPARPLRITVAAVAVMVLLFLFRTGTYDANNA